MTNGQDTQNQMLNSGLVTHLDSLQSDEEKIRTAYRSTLIREPNDEELDADARITSDERRDRPKEGIRQMVWALITCSEVAIQFLKANRQQLKANRQDPCPSSPANPVAASPTTTSAGVPFSASRWPWVPAHYLAPVVRFTLSTKTPST